MIRVRLPVAIAVVALVLVGLLATFTGSTASPAAPPTVATAPVTNRTLVCPDIDGTTGTTSKLAAADVAGVLTPPSQSTGKVTTTVLARHKSKTTPLQVTPAATVSSVAKTKQTIAVTAIGSVAATLAADQVTETPVGRNRALSGVRCEAPSTDWWFVGADGRVGFTDTLVLANPSPNPATVVVVLWGAKGPLLAPRLQAVAVVPHSALSIGIASQAPDHAQLGVHVHATSGAVTAALFDQRTTALSSDGGDFMPATEAPSRSPIVAGFSPGKGSRRLILADPGGADATVALRVVTASGSFTPTGDNQIIVRSGHTRTINLERAFDGTTGAVAVTSDQPVVAEGLSVTPDPGGRPDLDWLAATPPISGAAPIADGHEPDGGPTLLLLSAPKAAAQVRVNTLNGQTTTISIPAGHSVETNITATVQQSSGQWPFVVTPISGGPVYGVRVLRFAGAHGELITSEPLLDLPSPIRLPPVQADPTVATGR